MAFESHTYRSPKPCGWRALDLTIVNPLSLAIGRILSIDLPTSFLCPRETPPFDWSTSVCDPEKRLRLIGRLQYLAPSAFPARYPRPCSLFLHLSSRDSILRYPHYGYQHVDMMETVAHCDACNRSNITKVVAFLSGTEYDPTRVSVHVGDEIDVGNGESMFCCVSRLEIGPPLAQKASVCVFASIIVCLEECGKWDCGEARVNFRLVSCSVWRLWKTPGNARV